MRKQLKMSAIPPSILVRLVYYQQCRRKYWIILTLVFLLILYIIHVIQRESYYDAIIIGSGRYPGILNAILEGEGKKTLLILPSRMTGLSFHFEGLHSWERLPLPKRYVPIQAFTEEELENISKITGLPLEKIKEAKEDLGNTFDTMSLPSSGENVRKIDISSINPGELMDTQGNTYLAQEIYLVETTSLPLLEKFINLDNPKEATFQSDLGDKYTSPCTYNQATGLYEIQGGKEVYICEMLFEKKEVHSSLCILDSLILREQGLILYLLTRSKGAY